MLRPLLGPKDRRRDAVAHLDEVVQRQLGDRVRVRATAFGVARQRLRPVVAGLGEAPVELHDVFEAAVHPLAVERHDRVGRIADERDPAADPRPAMDRDQCPDRALAELRSRILPQNERSFQLLAEGPADEIRKLQREIDEYLGIDSRLATT